MGGLKNKKVATDPMLEFISTGLSPTSIKTFSPELLTAVSSSPADIIKYKKEFRDLVQMVYGSNVDFSIVEKSPSGANAFRAGKMLEYVYADMPVGAEAIAHKFGMTPDVLKKEVTRYLSHLKVIIEKVVK